MCPAISATVDTQSFVWTCYLWLLLCLQNLVLWAQRSHAKRRSHSETSVHSIAHCNMTSSSQASGHQHLHPLMFQPMAGRLLEIMLNDSRCSHSSTVCHFSMMHQNDLSLAFLHPRPCQCSSGHVCPLQMCSKQYQSAMELDAHLSSYDHHHKKVCGESGLGTLVHVFD